MRRHIFFMLAAMCPLWCPTVGAASGDTFHAAVGDNGGCTMMFTDLGGGKAAVGNGYGACVDYRYEGTLAIPATVTSGGATYTVTEVSKFAFYLCNKVTKLVLPASLDRIDDFAFYGCRALVETNKTANADDAGVKIGAIRNGSFALTSLTKFWVDDASQCDKGIFRGCDNMKWVVFDGSDTQNTLAAYDRSGTDSRTDGLPKSTVVYLPEGVGWTRAYDAGRTSLEPTGDDWAHANYVYVDAATGERKSQFVAFGYSVPRLGVTKAVSSYELPLGFTASLAYISRGASSAQVQTICVPMEVPMGRYNSDAAYSKSKAYVFDHYDPSAGKVVFQRVSTLPADTPGLLMDFSNDVLANTNAKVSAFEPATIVEGAANSNLSYYNWLAESEGKTKPNGYMIGYYDTQDVLTGAWAYAGTGNTYDSGGAIKEGTLFKVSKETKSAPMRAILWLDESSSAKASTLPAVFLDEDDATTLIRGIADHEPADGAWYTLGGMRLAGKPTTRGIYIHRGRRVSLTP